MIFLKKNGNDSVYLRVYIQPKSSENKICGIHGNALKLRITAPPVEGKANQMVISFLSKILKIPKASLIIDKGQQCRIKKIAICHIDPDSVEKSLAALVG